MLNPFNQVPNFSKLLRPRESRDTVTVLLVNVITKIVSFSIDDGNGNDNDNDNDNATKKYMKVYS